MGFGDKCCVGGCNNDRRYPEKWLIHSHVGRLSFHKPNNQMIEAWSRQVQKGRKDFAIGKSRESVVVCFLAKMKENILPRSIAGQVVKSFSNLLSTSGHWEDP